MATRQDKISRINQIKENQSLTNFELDCKTRIEILKNLKRTILKHEQAIYESFMIDLNKSAKEVYLCEISEAISEIDYFIKHLKKWTKPKNVKSSYQTFGTKSKIFYKPKGKVLIIVPFNYPFNLCFVPLVGSLGSGNKTLIKLSNQTPNINKIMKQIINEAINIEIVDVIEDFELKSYDEIYEYEPNMVFFTGSTRVGKIIEQECTKRNILYTTELGGQCPCLVESIKNDKVYDRIIWAKFLNAGQTCVGINYIIYNENINDFVDNLIKSINKQYPNCLENKNMVKIISKDAFNRLIKIINENKENILYGGNYLEKDLMIEPTIINMNLEELGKYGEIFGPILFISKSNKNIEELTNLCNSFDSSPLAAYLYSKNKNIITSFLKNINAGGYCINDSLIHLTNPYLPFGGVYTSGSGSYHGYYSFLTFSFIKPIVINNKNYDIPIKFINNKIDLQKTKKLIKLAKVLKK